MSSLLVIDACLSEMILNIIETSSREGYENMFGDEVGEAVAVGFSVGWSVGLTVMFQMQNNNDERI